MDIEVALGRPFLDHAKTAVRLVQGVEQAALVFGVRAGDAVRENRPHVIRA